MDYIAQYYKNYYLQLQEQLNHLTKMLYEAPPRTTPPTRVPRRPQVVTSIERAVLGGASTSTSQIENLLRMSWDDFRNYIRDMPEAFQREMLERYGQISVGPNRPDYPMPQRKLPDGSIEVWNPASQTWIPISKPGYLTYFGRMGSNGQLDFTTPFLDVSGFRGKAWDAPPTGTAMNPNLGPGYQ